MRITNQILLILSCLILFSGCKNALISFQNLKSSSSSSGSSATATSIAPFGWIGGVKSVTNGWMSASNKSFVTGNEDGMFSGPADVAIDTVNGFFYVVDSGNARIEKFNLSTGAFVGWIGKILTTGGTCITGVNMFTGGWCYGGVSAPGTGDGMFSSPKGISIDTVNDALYVADSTNHRIQRFVLSTGAFVGWIGKINTAGGTCSPAATATTGWCSGGGTATSTNGTFDGMFTQPSGVVAIPSANTLLVVDSSNSRIQKFNLSTGAFIGWIGKVLATGGTCPGTGLATNGWCNGAGAATSSGGSNDGMFNQPAKIAIDTTNDKLYVADRINHRIQKFTLSTGIFIGWIGKVGATGGSCPTIGSPTATWCAGAGTSATAGTFDGMFSQPNGIAIDVPNDLMFVSESSNARVQKFTLSTGAPIGWIGKISAIGGTCAPSGSAASTWCNGSGVATSNGGSGDGMYMTPGGLAVNSTNGTLYVADGGNHRIQKVSETSGTPDSGNGAVAYPKNNWDLTGLKPTSGALEGMFNGSASIAFDYSGGYMYAADINNHRVQKIDLATGAAVGWIGRINTTGGTCTAGPGLFTGGWCTGGTSMSGTGDGMFNSITSLAVDNLNGFLYVTDNLNNRIQKFVLSSGAFVGWIGSVGLTAGTSATCLTVSVATSGWCIGGVSTFGAQDGMFNSPRSVAIDSTAGILYVADYLNSRIQKFNASTGAFIGWVGRIGAVGGTCTAGINLFSGGWCSGGNAASGSGDGMMMSPSDLAIDSTNGLLYVADNGNNRVQKFNLATGAFIGWIGFVWTPGSSATCLSASMATTGWCIGGTSTSGSNNGMFINPNSIEVDVARNLLYVADTGNYRIQKFNLTTGAFIGWIGNIGSTGGTCTAGIGNFTGGFCSGGTPTFGNGDGMMNGPATVRIDPSSGIFYVNDANNNRVSRYNYQ